MRRRTDSARARAHARTARYRQPAAHCPRRHPLSVGTILLVILILLLIGALPSWSHSKSWGYGPTGGLGLVVVIVVILLVLGKI